MPYYIAVKDDDRNVEIIVQNAIGTRSAAERIGPLVEKDYPGKKAFILSLPKEDADAIRQNNSKYKECKRCVDWVLVSDFVDDHVETEYCSECRILNDKYPSDENPFVEHYKPRRI